MLLDLWQHHKVLKVKLQMSGNITVQKYAPSGTYFVVSIVTLPDSHSVYNYLLLWTFIPVGFVFNMETWAIVKVVIITSINRRLNITKQADRRGK